MKESKTTDSADLHLLPSRAASRTLGTALTLREVCGLTTEEIARAFLTVPPTLAQRIVRAKAKIREARIPYQVPSPDELPERLDTVLQVIYLVFNEGYSASSGGSLTRPDLSGEAIRLGRLLLETVAEPEAVGLLALMLLQESRRIARTSPAGELYCWSIKTARCGIAIKSRRAWRWSSGRYIAANVRPVPRFRRRLRPCMRRRPTGGDGLAADRRLYTTCCNEQARHRSLS